MDSKEVKLLREYKIDTEVRKLARQKAYDYIVKFDSIKLNRNNSIAFLGQNGAGKTHLLLAIGKALIEREKGVEVVYMPYIESSNELKNNAFNQEVYNNIINKYKTCELLIIDDLFKDKIASGEIISKLTSNDMKHIYPIINYRYINKLPTIYSSEADGEMLMEFDGAIAGRILESCKDNLIIFKNSLDNDCRINFINKSIKDIQKEEEEQRLKAKNKFNNFEARKYDYDKLEKKLLDRED